MMLGLNIDPWMCAHVRCLPASHGELIFLEFACMVLFAIVAVVMTVVSHFAFARAFSILYICRSGIGNGATFPVSVLLALYPFSENVHGLFSNEQVLVALMIGSATVAALQLYALLKGP
jgi:hypothetical protein